MAPLVSRIEARSLKAACVEALERLVISGRAPIGSALPPERDLAERLGASRPVVHEALVELAAKGLVRIEPRKGVFVNDFYRRGTLAALESIVLSAEGELPPPAHADVLAFRRLIEAEAARLAAARRGEGYLDALRELLAAEAASDLDRSAEPDRGAALEHRVELDFEFHRLVAEASGSLVYPLLVNSFRPLYLRLIRRFYAALGAAADPSSGSDLVLDYHRRVVAAISEGDEAACLAAMRDMLAHGEAVLGAGTGAASGLRR